MCVNLFIYLLISSTSHLFMPTPPLAIPEKLCVILKLHNTPLYPTPFLLHGLGLGLNFLKPSLVTLIDIDLSDFCFFGTHHL